MGKPLIVWGDKTDHGGTVIGSSAVSDTHGKQIARVGDAVSCPKRGHNNVVIVTGDSTFILDGQPVAYDGCKTSCGATLISSQAVTTTGDTSGEQSRGSSGSSAPQNAVAASSAPQKQAASQDYDQHFVLLNDQTGEPLEHVKYRIQLEDGRLVEGATDERGKTEKLTASSPINSTIEVLL